MKINNLFLSLYSYIGSSVTHKALVKGMPLALGVELTNHCNLNCVECDSGSGTMSRPRGYMDLELYKSVLQDLGPYLYNINLYFQGEPMLHPMFRNFLEQGYNSNTVISTNGHFLNQENSEMLARSGLKKLIISLDGMDQEIYSLYRLNGDFAAVIKGIEFVTEAVRLVRSSMQIEIQFLVNKHNEHQIPLAKAFAKRKGIVLRLKSMQIINKENFELWLPSKERFKRYKLLNGEYTVKNTLPNRCARLWFNPVITWDGKVIPCCFDKNAEHILGDLNNETFKEIWEGSKYMLFRKSILKGRDVIDICRNCTSGLLGVNY